MLKNKAVLLSLSLVAAISVLFLLAKLKPQAKHTNADSAKSLSDKINSTLPKDLGEKISYSVKLRGMQIGRSFFTYLSQEEVAGRKLNLMLFETKLSKLSDTEKVYSDPDTLLPVRVERSIKKLLTKENIIEDYNQADFSVSITKITGGKSSKQVIRKSGAINNAILLPHYLRRLPEIAIGTVISANLPTRDLTIKVIAIEEITVPAGTFTTYHFQSTPKQIDIWITADERRIPIKIESSGILGYSMVMKEYSPK